MGRWPRSLTSVAIPYGVTAPQQLNTKLFEVPPAFFFILLFFVCWGFFVCDTRRNNCNLFQVLDLFYLSSVYHWLD